MHAVKCCVTLRQQLKTHLFPIPESLLFAPFTIAPTHSAMSSEVGLYEANLASTRLDPHLSYNIATDQLHIIGLHKINALQDDTFTPELFGLHLEHE